MPCFGYSIPAFMCVTGSKLMKVKGSVCSICYARKGRYIFKTVQEAMIKRAESLSNPLWVEAMVTLIKSKRNQTYFRWHDSGDLQSTGHLCKIVEVALRLPNITFWLPTREYGIISSYINERGGFPDNLTVRLSSFMLDGKPPTAVATRLGVVTSGVLEEGASCPAPKQGSKCLDCRACWDKNIPNVNYKKH